MIEYHQIRDVHLEISTLCNASCAWCPRNFWGYPYNSGYPELNLTLDQCKQIFTRSFLEQLTSIKINGNFGDFVMNPHGPDIVEYFLSSNPKLDISINTNGGARDLHFWTRLGALGVTITFALDGLEDTHHLYRQNTLWQTVIKNARVFIDAGGHAIWQMIKFKHNKHQIPLADQLSKELGFEQFVVVNGGRDTAPVFDNRGQLVHVLGDYSGSTEFQVLFHKKKTDQVLLEDIIIDRQPKKHVACQTKHLKSIYIAANGDVSPCCFTGFYPHTYGHGQYHQAANQQLVPMMQRNNALEYTLQECIRWFAQIECAWSIDSYDQGRLVICDDNCG